MTDRLEHVCRVVPIPPRRPDGHKGDFGRVLVIGGSVGMAGAPALTGQAALRGGAGLVTIMVSVLIWGIVAAPAALLVLFTAGQRRWIIDRLTRRAQRSQ